MIHGENSTVIRYQLTKNNHPESSKDIRLEIRLLIAFRDYHGTTHENSAINSAVQERSGSASVALYQGTAYSALGALGAQRHRGT
jgi:hypothetical protein